MGAARPAAVMAPYSSHAFGTPLGPGARKKLAFITPRSSKFTAPSPSKSASGSVAKTETSARLDR